MQRGLGLDILFLFVFSNSQVYATDYINIHLFSALGSRVYWFGNRKEKEKGTLGIKAAM